MGLLNAHRVGGEVKSVTINAAAASDTTLVAAVSGKRIRIVGMMMSSAASGLAIVQSSTTTELFRFSSSGGSSAIVLGFNEHGWAETLVGELLNLNTAVGLAISGLLLYVEVD